MDYWPWDLLTPRRELWRLQGVTINGGVTVAGTTGLARTDGGGIWVGEQTFLLTTRDQLKAARAIEASLDGGVGKIVAWSFDAPFAPGSLSPSIVPHADGTPFSDGAEYAVAPEGATVTAACALRATQLPITMLSGEIQGGERFSIVHAIKGWRRYSIARVIDGVIEIRPPLREAIPSGTGLNFLKVGCACRLANPDEFFGALDPSRIVEITARWVEAF